jgi:Recombination endonuclease VII
VKALLSGEICPDCKQDLPTGSFTKDARRKDGLAFYCRPCRINREEISRRKRKGPRRHRVRPRDLVVPEGSKWCPDCDLVKPLSEFPRNKRARSGYMTYCKPCHNARTRASVDANGGGRNYHLRRRYGITAEHFDAMLAEQGGLCAICREAPARHVDHDHKSNRVRGLLCFNCNGALGQFRDREDLMLRAVLYLGRNDGDSLDYPDLHVGLHVGDYDNIRPEGEPRVA